MEDANLCCVGLTLRVKPDHVYLEKTHRRAKASRQVEQELVF